jgi:hypothetical protein
MGNEASAYNNLPGLDADAYVPISASREMMEPFYPSDKSSVVYRKSLIKSAFSGVWSIYTIHGDGPSPRKGHFTVHDKETNKMYVGYGYDSTETYLQDLWCLDLDKLKWTQIPLFGDLHEVTPRASSAACLSHTPESTFIILFGGYAKPAFFTQLHCINVATGELRLIQTNGDEPCARTMPLTTIYNGKYYVWGGFDGSEKPKDLHVLDLTTRTWHLFVQDISGRTGIPHAVVGSKMYAFGGSKQGGILVIDLDKMYVSVEKTIGSEPNSEVIGGGMVAVNNNYLFFFGGKSSKEYQYAFMFAFDIAKKWWFVFHIEPDGYSVSTLDGKVTSEGLFSLPRTKGFSIVYNEKTRTLISALGEPMTDNKELALVSIGDALGFINLRDEMVECFRRTNNL